MDIVLSFPSAVKVPLKLTFQDYWTFVLLSLRLLSCRKSRKNRLKAPSRVRRIGSLRSYSNSRLLCVHPDHPFPRSYHCLLLIVTSTHMLFFLTRGLPSGRRSSFPSPPTNCCSCYGSHTLFHFPLTCKILKQSYILQWPPHVLPLFCCVLTEALIFPPTGLTTDFQSVFFSEFLNCSFPFCLPHVFVVFFFQLIRFLVCKGLPPTDFS